MLFRVKNFCFIILKYHHIYIYHITPFIPLDFLVLSIENSLLFSLTLMLYFKIFQIIIDSRCNTLPYLVYNQFKEDISSQIHRHSSLSLL